MEGALDRLGYHSPHLRLYLGSGVIGGASGFGNGDPVSRSKFSIEMNWDREDLALGAYL